MNLGLDGVFRTTQFFVSDRMEACRVSDFGFLTLLTSLGVIIDKGWPWSTAC